MQQHLPKQRYLQCGNYGWLAINLVENNVFSHISVKNEENFHKKPKNGSPLIFVYSHDHVLMGLDFLFIINSYSNKSLMIM